MHSVYNRYSTNVSHYYYSDCLRFPVVTVNVMGIIDDKLSFLVPHMSVLFSPWDFTQGQIK